MERAPAVLAKSARHRSLTPLNSNHYCYCCDSRPFDDYGWCLFYYPYAVWELQQARQKWGDYPQHVSDILADTGRWIPTGSALKTKTNAAERYSTVRWCLINRLEND